MQKRKKTGRPLWSQCKFHSDVYIYSIRYKIKGGLPIYIVHVSTLNDHVVSQQNRAELSLT